MLRYPADLFIAEAMYFCFAQQIKRQGIEVIFCNLFLKCTDLLYFINEPTIDAGCFGNCVYTHTQHQRILYPEYAVPFRRFNMLEYFFCMQHTFSVIS